MWVVVGDITSSGGRVLTGSPFTDIDGKPVARISDQATCPQHKGVFPIVDGDATIIIDGQPVALHGSTLACGCKVLAAQQIRVFVDTGGAADSVTGRTAAPDNANSPGFSTPVAASDGQPPYDERIQFVGTTGAPLANLAYVLHLDNGTIVDGTLDAQGRTQRVITPTPASIVTAELAPPQHAASCCAAVGLPAQRVLMPLDGVATNAIAIGSSIIKVLAQAEDRGLTSGEITMLRLVFGDAVDYASVKLHNHGYWMFVGFQPDDTATAPDGEIYLPADLFSTDFSAERNRAQRLLVHELTHVWQYQLGYPVKRVRGPRPNMGYAYTLTMEQAFCDYNMEAQGNILADYFLLKARTDAASLYESKYRDVANPVALYEHVLRDFISDPGLKSNLPKVTQ